MLDAIFAIGQAVSIFILLLGAYLVLVEAIETAANPEDDRSLHE